MTVSPAGERMTALPPRLAMAEAAELARVHFGLQGRLDPLASERDQNFRLSVGANTYVLKIANAAEPAAVTNLQTMALAHIARTDPGLPVPRVIEARDGRLEIPLPSGSIVRVLTWVEGTPLHVHPRSAGLRRAVGAMAARLTKALHGFRHAAEDHDLIWDIRNAGKLRPLLPSVPDPDLRARCEDALDRFDAETEPALKSLPWQVVHADFNPHNLLTDDSGTHISGILDFGDMVRTPRLCDLAVAASYQIEFADPLGSLIDVVAGWGAVLPLLPGERDLILDLVSLRMVATIVLSHWRAVRQPENAAYFLRNLPSSQSGFEAVTQLDRGAARTRLADALGKDVA